MFKTKKELKREIEQLESRLERERSINKIIDDIGPFKCWSVACKGCEHAICIRDEYYSDGFRLVGCDVTVSCEDYKRKTIPELSPSSQILRYSIFDTL